MLKKHFTLGLMTCMLGISGLAANAQAVPTASSGSQVQIGAGGTFIHPDYGQKNNTAITIYGDYDLARWVGLEGDFNFNVHSPLNIKENTFLVGPRAFIRYGRFLPYAKVLVGLGTFHIDGANTSNNKSFLMYGFGGGVDYTATRKINIRAIDFTSQHWNTFSPGNLTPYTITVGAAYSFR